MSDWLDDYPELLGRIAEDLQSGGASTRGRRGMTLESILRCAILTQYRQVDYRTPAFYLRDSVSSIEFARREGRRAPSKSTLQALISAIRRALGSGEPTRIPIDYCDNIFQRKQIYRFTRKRI